MNDFKSAYQSAVQDMNRAGMKEFHIDASVCMDEGRHRKRMVKQVSRVATTAFSTICIVFLCGFGTVKAAEYAENIIRVNEWGFRSADPVTMTRQDEEVEAAYPLGEEMMLKSAGDQEEAVVEDMETTEVPVKNYSSWEEFEENEDILFPQPSINIGKEIEATDITVCDDWAMVRYDVDGKVLWIERTDYGNTQGHASSKVFPGGVCNERSYTTAAGYTYTLVDSVKEREEEPLQIHAGISVGSYEIFMDFMGYGRKEAEEIIDSVDVSLYE